MREYILWKDLYFSKLWKRESMISASDYYVLIQQRFEEAGNPETAQGQMKYMRYQFEYFGLKAPAWSSIVNNAMKTVGVFSGAELQEYVCLCFKDDHREMHYAGLQMLEKQIKKEEIEAIHFLEECIVTNSWWDTVDWISKLVGWHFMRFPELQYPTAQKWISSDSMWLQRVAIIHQLLYREKTDEKLLFNLILKKADSKEFFIQKACGWALRNCSRVNKVAVTNFVSNHKLSALTVREGMRLIKAGKV
jgi:3-methyladenine DNA glycosylase AlkD